MAEQVAQPRRPPSGAAKVTPDCDEFVRRHPQRIEGFDVLGQPEADTLDFGLEGAEQAVPDDQDSAVVAIQVLRVGAVVDTVMGRRIEDEFNWSPEFSDSLRVNEELVDKIDRLLQQDHPGGKSEEAQQHPEGQ